MGRGSILYVVGVKEKGSNVYFVGVKEKGFYIVYSGGLGEGVLYCIFRG